MEINKNITKVNRAVMDSKENKYIVIHYVGAVSSAKNNTTYFKNENRGASAHYFVDDNSIWQCVEEKDSAWHCGTKGTYYSKARNNNSIGIEMCCFSNNGKLDISEKTIANTIELVKEIMKRYNIPTENVIRHYDVTHKVCPAPFVNDVSRWNDFKNRLSEQKTTIVDKKTDVVYQGYDNKKKKWLGTITNYNNTSINGYSGNFGNGLGGIRVKLSNGAKITTKSHIKGGKWLSEISKWDNTSNGYSGIKEEPIDAVMIKASGYKIEYRVHLLKDNRWLNWISGYNTKDSKNGYAGNIGESIDAIQIRIVD
jgi:hypothetical protein